MKNTALCLLVICLVFIGFLGGFFLGRNINHSDVQHGQKPTVTTQSNAEKLNVSSQMLDRGIMSINDVREIWNLTPVEGGDARIIRGEYYNADEKVTDDTTNTEANDDESE